MSGSCFLFGACKVFLASASCLGSVCGFGFGVEGMFSVCGLGFRVTCLSVGFRVGLKGFGAGLIFQILDSHLGCPKVLGLDIPKP